MGFLLAEIVNASRTYCDGRGKIHFGCGAFRPVRRADLSCLQALLVPELAD